MRNIDRKLSVFVVIPTIRNLDFLLAWGDAFYQCTLLIVSDSPMRSACVPKIPLAKVVYLDWNNIKKDLRNNEWIISRHNAGIRAYGFWKAWQLGAEVIITLDDDCYPNGKNFVSQHLDNLNFRAPEHWVSTYPDPQWMFTRGMPYKNRGKIPIKVSHGLWSGALDLDGQTEIKLPKLLTEPAYPPLRQIVPKHYFYPMCSMNLAFRREVTPLMFFPMMGSKPDGVSWGYDRYDDIWAGIFSKKIMDHLNWGVLNGSPSVEHRKASMPVLNCKKEEEGLGVNEWMWQRVAEVRLTANTPVDCYRELARKVVFPPYPYFESLKKAMEIWVDLFN